MLNKDKKKFDSGPLEGSPERKVRSKDSNLEKEDRLILLLEEWAAEDPAYDEQTLPELKQNLDRNRPEYRKLFGRR